MSEREKTLAMIIGGVMLVVINIVLVKFFLNQHSRLKSELLQVRGKIAALEKMESERTLWAARDTWLNGLLEPLGDPQVAMRNLTEDIKKTASKYNLTVETPTGGVPSNHPYYTSLGVKVTVHGNWKSIFPFLRDLQEPEKMIVLDPLTIKVVKDEDHLVDVNVTKWYAPQ